MDNGDVSPSNQPEQRVSKSALKRRALEAQRLGQRLTELTNAALDSVNLNEGLRKAVIEYRRMVKKEARRRQLQFIGRLMRDEEQQAAVADAIAAIDHTSAQQKFRHHQLETWRERLLSDAASLTAYVTAHPGTDVKILRDIIVQYHRAGDVEAQKHLARKLYRFLNDNSASDDF